jgi:hypothetical protein
MTTAADQLPKGISSEGGRFVDPSVNVRELVGLEMRRQDDLREAESRRINETLMLITAYEEKLRGAEAKRIDAIRAVDTSAGTLANERATQQATVLANQVVQSADTLRGVVATTAAASDIRLQQIIGPLTERLSSVEKSINEGAGKSTMSDPLLATLATDMRAILAGNAGRQGASGVSQPLLIAVALGMGGIIVYFVEHLH